MYLVFDGGNHGPKVMKGYGSYKLYDKKGGNLLRYDQLSWHTPLTNNQAEYMTLTTALGWINDNIDDPESVYGSLTIVGDSELVRQQVLGNWQVSKKHLKGLRSEVVSLLGLWTRWEYLHAPRAEIVAILGH